MKALKAIAFGAALLVTAPAFAQSFSSYAIGQEIEDIKIRADEQEHRVRMMQQQNEHRMKDLQYESDRRMRDMEDQMNSMRLQQLLQPYGTR